MIIFLLKKFQKIKLRKEKEDMAIREEEEEMEELKQLCEPLVNYLTQNHDPHTQIIVSMDSILITKTEIGIPLDNND